MITSMSRIDHVGLVGPLPCRSGFFAGMGGSSILRAWGSPTGGRPRSGEGPIAAGEALHPACQGISQPWPIEVLPGRSAGPPPRRPGSDPRRGNFPVARVARREQPEVRLDHLERPVETRATLIDPDGQRCETVLLDFEVLGEGLDQRFRSALHRGEPVGVQDQHALAHRHAEEPVPGALHAVAGVGFRSAPSVCRPG